MQGKVGQAAKVYMASRQDYPDNQVQEMDRQVFELVNQVRQRPQDFIPHLEDMQKRFDGQMYHVPNKTSVRTKEGVQAVRDAIAHLRRQQPCRQLAWNEKLALCSRHHVEDIGPKGMVQHEASDGRPVRDRFKKHGQVVTHYGENLSFHCYTALEVVLQCLVDDGVPDRGHRENIFTPEYRAMGCYTGRHDDFETMTVIDFVAGFISHDEEDHIERQMNAFLKEEVDFPEMPHDVRGWKQNTKVTVNGHHARKTVERVCRLYNGQQQRLEKHFDREFDL